MSVKSALRLDNGRPRPVIVRTPRTSRWRVLREVFVVRKSAGIGAFVLAALVLAAAAAPIIAPYDPSAQNLDDRYAPPTRAHLMGTDPFGRDILSRIIWGARISLAVGVIVVLIATLVGAVLGLTAGYVGGGVDRGVSFFVNMLMAFPLLLVAIAFLAVFGAGLYNVMIAVGLGSVPMFARVIRAESRTVRDRDYVTAARSIGATHLRIVMRHILPNITASIIVLATTRIGTAILTESSLSFLGLGIRPPTPSWGIMVAEGRTYLEQAPWIALFPGVVIMVTLLSFNLFGDGLRDALDVRLRGGR
ncbi:MAG TPA: ABC transporter permease [bacterium]|nr:ABC transporter permease [bacterium]